MPLVIHLTVVQFLLSARPLLAWLRLQSDAVGEVDAMFGTWAVGPRLPLQLASHGPRPKGDCWVFRFTLCQVGGT
jgi:hypothetical protein